jgi:hydrogenase nickel incorporation protein HypB
VSKCDLLAVLDDFKPERAKQYLHDIASAAPVIELSAKTGDGMASWFDWLKQQIAQQQARIADGSPKFHRHHPHHHEHVHAHEHHHHHEGG